MKELTKFERMETLSLLELAIVERHIVGEGVFFQSVGEMHEYQVLDQTFDPHEYFTLARISSGAQAIIPRVVAFLG